MKTIYDSFVKNARSLHGQAISVAKSSYRSLLLLLIIQSISFW
jgi:hypothetical protein